ncbi:MAG: hypothetical protein KKH52_00440, partial [Nanoarchaeota archaeon]|nr:hypothetical protein [Nanoarchaeota archaeon]
MNPVLLYFIEGPRIMFSGWRNKFFPKRYKGNATEICRLIVNDCWNGRFYQTSTHNFKQFWTRDFFWCCKSLLKLGFQKEVQQTLRYALNRFKKYNKITTTLTPRGSTYDFPTYAVDTLPSFIHCLRISKFPYYDHKDFLNKEIQKFFRKVVDPETGLVNLKHFSSMKDMSVRKSSCYDNCQVAMLAKDLTSMKLFNPFKKYNYPQLIKDHFWNGNYFFDDITRKDYVAGDANLFPFIFGIINDK